MPETLKVPLSILGSAVTACYDDSLTESLTNRSIRRVLELGGPIVVAEELRRIAAEWSPVDEYGARKLRRRADELDPPAVRQED